MQGFGVSALLCKIGSSTVTLTTLTVSSPEGNYAIDVPSMALGQVVTLQLFDSVFNASIINLDGTMYKSNVATTVVV